MPTRNPGWLRGPLWDVGLLAFGWLPFYAWVAVATLGTSHWGSDEGQGFAAAVAVALALNFAHRQYVLVLVYGDPEAIAERPLRLRDRSGDRFCGRRRCALVHDVPVAQTAVLVALGTWNVWHVIQQRYGFMRVYAGRARGGLESREAARADKSLLWSSVAVTACGAALFRVRSLEGVPQAARLLSVVRPLLAGPLIGIATAAALAVWALTFVRWWRIESASTGSVHWPRWIFGLSTLALLAIFVVHGPVVGYVVFGVAHSIEYLAFVYQFGEKKYSRATSSVAALLLGSVRRAPLVLVPLLVGYAFLYRHRFALAYVTYYASTSVLHYLYDGWIWRLRQPRVARPLGVEG